jgi:hypothetical protein
MAKPTVSEHRTDIRAMLAEASAGTFTDAEVDQNLANALNVLSSASHRTSKVNKTGLTTDQIVIDLATDCPAESVVEVIPSGGAALTEFRARGNELVLKAALGATSADFVYRARYAHDGTNVDWYPAHLRGGVCMLAAALLIIGRQRELSETDPNKAHACASAAQRLFDTAISILLGRAAGTRGM